MNEFQKDYLLKRQDYGVLYPYVMEETVTDIHWNGRQLWIDDLEKVLQIWKFSTLLLARGE